MSEQLLLFYNDKVNNVYKRIAQPDEKLYTKQIFKKRNIKIIIKNNEFYQRLSSVFMECFCNLCKP